jgi:hypothetical protein
MYCHENTQLARGDAMNGPWKINRVTPFPRQTLRIREPFKTKEKQTSGMCDRLQALVAIMTLFGGFFTGLLLYMHFSG